MTAPSVWFEPPAHPIQTRAKQIHASGVALFAVEPGLPGAALVLRDAETKAVLVFPRTYTVLQIRSVAQMLSATVANGGDLRATCALLQAIGESLALARGQPEGDA